jgi:hypothetical protein
MLTFWLQMYEYHDQYKRAGARGDVDAQTRWSNQLRWEIARHAVGEEIVVYPLMEKHMGEKGKKLADHDREEHQVCALTFGFFTLCDILTPIVCSR